jgi:methyl-accepting chemotaxis protein
VSNATDQINIAIQQVTGNAAAVTTESAAAAAAAQKGSLTVEQTLSGMQSIKAKVGVSAEKVQEMGRRSEEIGKIVETIEDIASQTNLLALNTARALPWWRTRLENWRREVHSQQKRLVD